MPGFRNIPACFERYRDMDSCLWEAFC